MSLYSHRQKNFIVRLRLVRLDFSRGRNPSRALFYKSFISCTEPFFLGGTRPSVTSGKIKMRDCFVLKGRRMKNFSFSLTLTFFDFLRAFFSSA